MQLTPQHKALWAIGLMSGTSLDGIDAALVRTDGQVIREVGATYAQPYYEEFRDKLRGLLAGEGNQQAIERELTMLHAAAVKALLAKADMRPSEVAVVGFHGQTIWHKPAEGKTLQIGDGPLLAREVGIAVVHDFRTHDMQHGGQGAPLVPVFHQALMHDEPKPTAILNIGGVANVTWIGVDGELIAFDTGPGNALLNDWVQQHTGQPYDDRGALAATGTVDQDLVRRWLAHAYFQTTPPKSLDRDSFDVQMDATMSKENGAATLTEFTVQSIVAASQWFPECPKQWLVCGGGVHNTHMMQRLNQALNLPVTTMDSLGHQSDMIEAQAFAYLAIRSMRGLPLTFPSTTGTRKAVSGGVFWA